jgi:DNA-binding LacI/PurR family transcriptional regulator
VEVCPVAVTIRDVAREAQVSVATVSRALSSPDLVRPATRDRVLTAATQLGYQPNRAARGLITGKTGNLGILVPDLNNPFFTGVLKGVQARARQADYSVFVADSDEDRATEEQLLRAMAKQVDGVIVCSPGIDDTQLYEAAGITSLVMLNRRGLRVATQQHGVELIELGPFPPRYEGGLQACDLALANDPTAIIAYNDIMALGVLARLRDRGVNVPGDVSVTGFDDLMFAALCSPPLTTVAMPLMPAGTLAVDLLLDGLNTGSAEVRQVDLDTQLIVRATTSPPP